MHVHTIAPEDATGLVRELYDADLTDDGYVSNISRLYSLRPEVLVAWRNLSRAIREPMDLRRYELATLAAGAALRCRYCVAAHGEVLESEFYDRDQLEKIVRDYRGGGGSSRPAPVSCHSFGPNGTSRGAARGAA